MAANVDPEEVQAILDLTEPPQGGRLEVRARDFARPLRLSPKELGRIELDVRRALPEVEAVLARALREKHALKLVEAGEVSCEGTFATLSEPLAAVRFEVGAQPAWLVWELHPALAAVEVALGAGEPGLAQERPFSTVERKVLLRLVEPLIGGVCQSLGLTPSGLRVPRIREDLGSWREGGPGADRRRLFLHLEFEGPGAPSVLRLYLPGIDPRAPARSGPPAALPAHLRSIQVELAARLGANDVPLAQLLSLEPGDVIPLSAPAGEPLRIYVEDQLRAHGVLGSKHGHLALRITAVGPEDEDA